MGHDYIRNGCLRTLIEVFNVFNGFDVEAQGQGLPTVRNSWSDVHRFTVAVNLARNFKLCLASRITKPESRNTSS